MAALGLVVGVLFLALPAARSIAGTLVAKAAAIGIGAGELLIVALSAGGLLIPGRVSQAMSDWADRL
jgi:hypothetical protein